jgi:hypothetical protein
MKPPPSNERVQEEGSALTGQGQDGWLPSTSDGQPPEASAGGDRGDSAMLPPTGPDGECCALLRRRRSPLPTAQVRPVRDRKKSGR